MRDLEKSQEKVSKNMDDIIVGLVNKYRESLLKEAMLLVDRYRL